MPTPTFLEPGTDATQDLSFFSFIDFFGGAGTPVSDSSQAHTGLRSIKVVIPSGGSAIAGVVSPDGSVQDAGTRLSCWIRLSTATPSADVLLFAPQETADGAAVLAVGLTTGGVLVLQAPGAGTVTGTTVLSATTWTRLTLSYVITSASNWSAKLYINGILELSTGNALGTLANVASQGIYFGVGETGSAPLNQTAAITLWFDDIYVDNGTDLADPGTTAGLSVTAKRPFANGTTNGFTGTGLPGTPYGTGNARYVNNNYPVGSDTTSYVSVLAAGSAITEEYNIEGASVNYGDVNLTGATIVGVQGWLFANSSLTETTDQIVVDGTQSAIASITSTATLFTQNSATPTVYPAGTGTDVGIVTGIAATTKVFGTGILVAFIPAASVTASIDSLLQIAPPDRRHFTSSWITA